MKASSSSPVAVRLSPDALHLEVLLAPDARMLAPAALAALIRERSARLQVDLPLRPEDLEILLRSRRRGSWITLLSGTAPTPPTDGRLELLVPVPVAAEHQFVPRERHVVRAGTPLARLQPATPGQDGYDLLGRKIPARPPRMARLPAGQHTQISADGTLLRAACDGEVVLRNLLIHVMPMHVYHGDLLPGDGTATAHAPLFVTGSLRPGARVEVDGDLHVQGDVEEAEVVSARGSISVRGRVVGTATRPAVLRAHADITCGQTLHARLEAGRDIRLFAEARQSGLQAAGNVYLRQSVERGLQDVQLQVGGGLLPVLDLSAGLVSLPTDRQHVRVATRLAASLALHGVPPLTFYPCTIVDLSTTGARCRLAHPLAEGDPAPGTIVQLKFELPGSSDQVLTVARLSRRSAPGVMGLAFLQMTERDHDRLTEFCLQLLLVRRQSKLATRADRARPS